MNKQIFSFTHLKVTTLSAALVLLTACGGGGGGSASSGSDSSIDTSTPAAQTETQVETELTTGTSETETVESEVVVEPDIEAETEVTVEPEVAAEDEPTINEGEPTFTPDEQRLDSAAVDSNELYVEPDFTFENSTGLSVYITVTDEDGNLRPRTLIKMYSVPEATENWDDLTEDDKQLVLTGVTNSNGVLDISIDLTETVSKVLTVANVLGIENKAILSVDNQLISYNFE